MATLIKHLIKPVQSNFSKAKINHAHKPAVLQLNRTGFEVTAYKAVRNSKPKPAVIEINRTGFEVTAYKAVRTPKPVL